MRSKVFWFRVLLSISIISIIIIAFTSVDFPSIDFHHKDKIEHIFAFFMVSTLLYYSFPKVNFWFTIFPLLLFFGIGIEIFQSFTPNRYSDVKDIMADFVGVTCFYVMKALV